MAKLRFGIRIPSGVPAPDVNQLKRFVEEAEALGFESIWAGDHNFHHTNVLQPFELLSWVAAVTSRVRLGTAVLLMAYLNPVLVARSAATLDHLSGGRFTLGVGIGGTDAEFASLGVPMKERVGRLLEGTAVMRRLWSEEDVSHEGRYFRVEKGNIRPKPVQPSGVPIYYAGRVERMLDRIPEVADGWVAGSHYTLEEFLAGVRRIRERASALQRDPQTISFARVHDISVHADRETARQRAHAHWVRYYGPQHDVEAETTYGTPDDCREGLAPFAQAETESVEMILEPTSLELEELRLLREVTEGLT